MKRTQRTDGAGGNNGGTITEAIGIFCTVLIIGQVAAAAVLFSTGQIDLDRCGRAVAVLFPESAQPPATLPIMPTAPTLSDPAPHQPPILARDPADPQWK